MTAVTGSMTRTERDGRLGSKRRPDRQSAEPNVLAPRTEPHSSANGNIVNGEGGRIL